MNLLVKDHIYCGLFVIQSIDFNYSRSEEGKLFLTKHIMKNDS